MIGKVNLNVISLLTNKSSDVNFYVLDGESKNLLSVNTSVDLGLVKFTDSCAINTCETDFDQLVTEFSDRFTGIGKMKDTEIKLHIDESVRPIKQKQRRIPFYIEEEVEKELERLEELDIIEKAAGPTPWVSPIVPVSKKQGVRICIDSRAINTAIQREKYPIPTIDDLMAEMNGATTFSNIDLNKGSHQLELHKDSRFKTTFSTHKGLYRYKRLSFGINSAAETFQKKNI